MMSCWAGLWHATCWQGWHDDPRSPTDLATLHRMNRLARIVFGPRGMLKGVTFRYPLFAGARCRAGRWKIDPARPVTREWRQAMPKATKTANTGQSLLTSAAGAVAATTALPLTASAAPSQPYSFILDGAARLAQLDNTVDTLKGDDLARVENEMIRLEDAIMAETPTSAAEVAVVLMLAISMINIGNSYVDGADLVECGEFAARRATRVLATIHGIDLRPLAGDRYLGEHIAPVFRAGEVTPDARTLAVKADTSKT